MKERIAMECQKVREKLSAFIDRELKDGDRLRVEQHLANCQSCMQEARLLAQTWSALELWRKIEVPSSFKARFWRKVRERESPVKRLIRTIVEIPVPVATVIVLLIGLFVGNYAGNILYPKERKLVSNNVISLAESDILYLDAFDDLPSGSIGNVYVSLLSPKEDDFQGVVRR